MPDRFLVNLKSLLTLDVRSLAIFRIGIGICLAYEALTRWPYRHYLYGEDGLLPLADRYILNYPHSAFGILQWSDSALAINLVFVAFVIAAFAFLLGIFTRTSQIILVLIWLSLTSRNPVLDQVGSSFLGFILLWTIPLPLAHSLSIDALLKKRKQLQDVQVLNFAGLAFLLQLFAMYWFAFLYKLGPIWWSHGTGVYFSLHGESYTKLPAKILLEHPTLMILLTRLTQVLRLLGPFLFVIPGRLQLPARLLGLAAFIGLHLSFYICLSLGAFPWICIFAWCALIPRELWNYISSKASSIQPVLIVQNFKSYRLLTAAFVLLFLLSLISNPLNYFKTEPHKYSPLDRFTNNLQLRQSWRMYQFPEIAVSPWLVAEAEYDGGQNKFDLLREDGVLNFDLPPMLSDRYEIEPIRRIDIVIERTYTQKRLARRMAEGLCRHGSLKFDETHPKHGKPEVVRIHLLRALTPMPYQRVEKKEIKQEVLSEVNCREFLGRQYNTNRIKIISGENIETGTTIASKL